MARSVGDRVRITAEGMGLEKGKCRLLVIGLWMSIAEDKRSKYGVEG